MKIAIVGSRDVSAKLELEISAQIEALIEYLICVRRVEVTVVSGGARGVDSIARRVAEDAWVPCQEFIPDWEKHGKKAGFLRNKQIVDACDELHAWWDGKSKGTKHSIDLARKAGKPVTIHAI